MSVPFQNATVGDADLQLSPAVVAAASLTAPFPFVPVTF